MRQLTIGATKHFILRRALDTCDPNTSPTRTNVQTRPTTRGLVPVGSCDAGTKTTLRVYRLDAPPETNKAASRHQRKRARLRSTDPPLLTSVLPQQNCTATGQAGSGAPMAGAADRARGPATGRRPVRGGHAVWLTSKAAAAGCVVLPPVAMHGCTCRSTGHWGTSSDRFVCCCCLLVRRHREGNGQLVHSLTSDKIFFRGGQREPKAKAVLFLSGNIVSLTATAMDRNFCASLAGNNSDPKG